MKIKTSELIEHALDWAVNQIEECCDDPATPMFSTDWAQGGPIIERERINVDPSPDSAEWYSYYDNSAEWYSAHTPLIAAMRCYVANKLGDEVDIPDELTQGESK